MTKNQLKNLRSSQQGVGQEHEALMQKHQDAVRKQETAEKRARQCEETIAQLKAQVELADKFKQGIQVCVCLSLSKSSPCE